MIRLPRPLAPALLLAIICLPVTVSAGVPGLYSGRALGTGSAALTFSAGYPTMHLGYVWSPWRHVEPGLILEGAIDGRISTLFALRVQMLESPAGRFGLLVEAPVGLEIDLGSGIPPQDRASFSFRPGFRSGWDVWRGLTPFIGGWLQLLANFGNGATTGVALVEAGCELPLSDSFGIGAACDGAFRTWGRAADEWAVGGRVFLNLYLR